MQLPNERLEQLHTELRTALSERQSEHARTQHESGEVPRQLDQAETEIRNWTEDAQKVRADTRDDRAIADLVERAKQINQKLCEGFG